MTVRYRPLLRTSSPYEFQQLARYNAEVARGIVHTDEWKAAMAVEQKRFDERQSDDQ